jgi:hypothetical protein
MVIDVLRIGGPHLQTAVQIGTKLMTLLYIGMSNSFSISRWVFAVLKIHIVKLLVVTVCDVVSGKY